MAPITKTQLHLFYKIDREVFCFLIYRLHRDLTQSLLVMALWLWLENIGYPSLIPRVMGLPPTLANVLINEAWTCLECLETDISVIPSDGGLPLTKRLMQRDISLRIFYLKRYTTITGIKSVLNNICAQIFDDILKIVLKSQNISKARKYSTSGASTSTSGASTSQSNTSNTPLVVPGFPHPLFGTFDLSKRIVNLDLQDPRIWSTKLSDDVTDEDKKMFLTFSRGFPVSETEVIQLFKCRYGDCVHSLDMGDGNVNKQKLFAVLILKTVANVDEILKGNKVAKLQINGKHIWARKYERRG